VHGFLASDRLALPAHGYALPAKTPYTAGITSGFPMAKPNYQYEKRQRDIANKKKQDEKRARKQAKNEPAADGSAPTPEPDAKDPGAPAAD
jgi:hypothetical protein